jgi:hypothetical protein
MRGTIVGLIAVLALAPLSLGQAIDKQTLDQVKDSSVFIKMKIPNVGEASGSGFVMKTTGDTVLIMTNRHVVVPEEGDLPQGAKHELWVVFRSGTPQQQELPAQLLAYDEREIRDITQPSPPPKSIWVVDNSQCHDGGGGDQADPHVVKLGNGNVVDLREKQSRREGEGKKLKAKG